MLVYFECQVDVASKKGDHLKKQSLEADLNTVSVDKHSYIYIVAWPSNQCVCPQQTSSCESLTAAVEIKAQKHELYKVGFVCLPLVWSNMTTFLYGHYEHITSCSVTVHTCVSSYSWVNNT